MMRFYVGLHQPSDAQHFDRCMVSVNRLRDRRGDFTVREWMMDSGAFTEVAIRGGYREGPEAYAEQVRRWRSCGTLVAAVAQDWMCEPFVVARTGLSVEEHQARTVTRYVELLAAKPGAYVMPVLQGYAPSEYVRHVRDYGRLLGPGQWVGVGSVCKRNARPAAVEAVLVAIHRERPDLRLHGFGLKRTALGSGIVRGLLATADSMAWSYAARREGRDANDWREARAYAERVNAQPWQPDLFAEVVHA